MTVVTRQCDNPEAEGLKRSDHLVRLPGGDWALWRWVGLRGTGFPIDGVLKLASPQCAQRADELNAAEDEAERAWEHALEALRVEMEAAEHERWLELSKVMKQLKGGKMPAALTCVRSAGDAIGHFAAACDRVDGLWAEFSTAFEEATRQTSAAIFEIANQGAFQEAILWQNRSAFHTALMPLVEEPPANNAQRNKHRRRREELVAMYWQRYCTKNDTVGFFGPVGWARLTGAPSAISVQPGDRLLAARNLYLEGWCIDALGSVIAEETSLRPWLVPRVLPTVHLEGDSLHLPLGGVQKTPRPEAALIRACSGGQTARQIAELLVAEGQAGFADEAEVFDALGHLHDRGIICWSLEVPWTLEPPSHWHIEENLKRQIERVEDGDSYRRARGRYDELIAARDRVAKAAGDAQELDAALGHLEATFTRLTGTAATRGDGKMYAGRTLVYEDCRRAIDVDLGEPLLEELGPPLSLVLASARWFIASVASTYQEAFRETHSALAREMNATRLDFITFWSRAQPLIFGDKRRLIKGCLADLQQRWADILAPSPDQRRVAFSCEQLSPRVLAEFAAPDEGWNYARYHSPDIMIAASGSEAIRRGDYQLVMGEFHVGTNTLCNTLFMAQHPCPEAVLKDLEADMGRPRVVPVPPKFLISSRDYSLFVSPGDFRLAFARDPSGIPPARVLPIASLVIEEGADGLVVSTRDGRLRFPILEVFADALSERVSNSFKMLAPGGHLPRVSIGRLVVHRETWGFAAPDLDFAFQDDEAYRYLGARRWAAENDLPRFVYFKSPAEVKPCFVDFDSRIYVDLLAKAIRRTVEANEQGADAQNAITVTEMLPTPEQAWLPDHLGRRYASELRMVALGRASRKA